MLTLVPFSRGAFVPRHLSTKLAKYMVRVLTRNCFDSEITNTLESCVSLFFFSIFFFFLPFRVSSWHEGDDLFGFSAAHLLLKLISIHHCPVHTKMIRSGELILCFRRIFSWKVTLLLKLEIFFVLYRSYPYALR